MAKKKKCTQCRNYFETSSKAINNYCSKECIQKAYQKKNQPKPIKKSKHRNKNGEYTLTWYKEQTWTEFSIYIRTRDCLRFKGVPNKGICVTCNREYDFKNLQAGHFISGRGNSVLFDETCVYTQCYGCNMGRGGAYVEYFIFMEQEWGREFIEELRIKKTKTVKYTKDDLLRLKETFINKTEELIKEYTNETLKRQDLHPRIQSNRGY